MKTLRVTLADIIGPTGTPNSTATVHARYVDTSGRGRDVHLTDGTIVVPVRRVASPDGDPEVFDFDVYANDVAPVREVDYGHLVEVSWTVVAPTGAKSSGVKRVQITDSMDTVVQLGLLSTPTPVPPYTGGYVTPETYAALVARVVALEDAPGGGGSGGTLTADDTPAAPAEGESATYFVTSAVVWPVGLVWSTDPDGGVEPTITDAALVSMFTLDGTTYAVLGSTFPAPVIPDTTPPSIPAGLSAVAASHTTVNLSWTASTDAVGVTGYEYRVDGGTAVDAGAGLSELVTGLTAATAYTFHVRAYDTAGNFSAWSTVANATTSAAPDVTAPTTPTGLSATATGSTSVNLAWTASTDAVGVTGYEYRIDGGTAVDAGAGVTEAVSGLTGSTEYDFEVRAYDAAGNRSGWSTVATETTDAAADVTAPTVGTLAGSAITSSGFTLTISGAADETALHATPYRFSTDDGATYSAWQTSATYAATGLAASTGYTCKHQTRDAAGNVSTGTGVLVTTGSVAWTPASLTLSHWYDASDTATITHAAGVISQWSDKSGNSRHLVQATGAYRPSTGLDTQNGLNVVTVASGQELAFVSAITAGTAYTVAIVATPSGGTNGYLASVDADQADAIITKFGGVSYEYFGAGPGARFALGSSGLSGYNTLIFVRDGVNVTSLVNGSASGSTATRSATAGTMRAEIAPSRVFSGKIAEMVVVPGALTGTDLTNLSDYLRTKWATA